MPGRWQAGACARFAAQFRARAGFERRIRTGGTRRLCIDAHLPTRAEGVRHPLGERFVVNNGAAGMPNFSNTRYGVITRLGSIPVPRALNLRAPVRRRRRRCVRRRAGGAFDATAWDNEFEQLWPRQSPAYSVVQTSHRKWARFFDRRGVGPRPLRECSPRPVDSRTCLT